jgi:sortase A
MDSNPSRRHRWLRHLSWALMGLAVLVLGYAGLLIGYQSYEQHRLASAWAHDHPTASIFDANAVASGVANLHPHLAAGSSLAKLLIPSVGFEAIVTEGADSGFLSSGPGHDERTAYPGEGGVVVIGNHNGLSFSWNGIKAGDQVMVEMGYGRYRYTVTDRSIVEGDDTSVISRPRSGEALLLTTCWPLWKGSFAGQRLVIEAVPEKSA